MSIKVLQYNLKGIKKINSYLNSLVTLPISNFQEEKIGVRKGFQFVFDPSMGVFTIRVLTDFLCRAETPIPINLFGATIQFDFIFKDFQEIVKQTEEHQVDIPDDLLITLISISYSTSRGILAALAAGSDYQNIFLPLADIQEFKAMLKNPVSKVEPK